MLTQAEIEEELHRVLDDLASSTEELRGLADESARRDVAFEVAWAHAILGSEGKSQDTRKADATVVTRDELFKKRVSQERLRAQYAVLSVLRARSDALRSLLVSVRAQV